MFHLLHDVRFTLRLVRRSPGFYATLLAIIVAGIGATTAMFSLVESLLLRPLPYPHPDELTMVWRMTPRMSSGPASVPDFEDWKTQATTFASMAGVDSEAVSLSSPGAVPEFLGAAYCTGDYFRILGVEPLRGRLLGAEDDRVGAPRAVVVGAALWHRRFGSDPSLVGRAITLDGEAFTVVGVAPEGFTFAGPGADDDIWLPLVNDSQYSLYVRQRGTHFMKVMGRRKPGVSLAEAQAQLTAIGENLAKAYPDTNARTGLRAVDLHETLVASSRSGVWVLFAAIALVFVVVCANVSNLLLTRAQSRQAEMAARAALGATPARLAGQVVTETAVVFLVAALGGTALARWLVAIFGAGVVRGSAARALPISVDAGALLFSVATCLVCGVVFGLVPALSIARVEPQSVLKETSARAGTGRAQRAVRGALVVAQVALAFGLLAASGLAVRAFAKVAATSPGFDPSDLATARVTLPDAKYDDAKAAGFYRELLARIARRPDVVAVAADDCVPMGDSNSNGSFKIEGRPPFARGEEPSLERNTVTPGYFAAMGISILRGRDFSAADTADGRRVMIISQSTAERFFPGEDPIGRRIDWGDLSDEEHDWREIVGVVGDVRREGLDQPVSIESYAPLLQHPSHDMMLVARSPRAEALLRDFPAMVQALDPDQAASPGRLMSVRVAQTIGSQRYVALLLAAFAAAALGLATLGLFGLVSFSTSQRTRELGIRLALGSTPGAVVALVMRGGMRLLGAGLGVGLVCAVVAGRLLASRIPGVQAWDLAVYATIPAVLGVAGLAACLLPAWRAVRIPPAIALRYE